MKKITLSGLIFFMVAFTTAFAQNESLFVESKFKRNATNVLQEKLFVHIDKTFFIAGEILWFKVYYVDASFHQLLDLSKVAYVEILDKNNVAVLQTKVLLAEGLGKGSLILPTSLASGYYTFRAYTNWMKNFSEDYFFHQSIGIVNSIKTPQNSSIVPKSTLELQFFPEGGNLVEGLKSKLAFRMAVNGDNGIDFSGSIVDQNGVTISTIRSLKFGIGSFYFTPQEGHSYKGIVKTSDGTILTQSLPVAHKSGYVMGLTGEEDNQITISITGKENEASKSDSLFLFVHGRQIQRTLLSGSLKNGSVIFTIEKKHLPAGISHITLFKGRNPVCERLYFLRPQETLRIEASTNKPKYDIRENVSVTLQVSDQNGLPQMSNMSIAVFRTDSLQEAGITGINGYLLLTSDLRGRIQSPDYYFSNSGPEVNEALDNVMLTHGWRRFSWDKIMNDTRDTLAFLPEYTGHIISGKVRNAQTGNVAGDIIAYLSIPGRTAKLYSTTSSPNGEIKFITKDFLGYNEIIIQPQSPVREGRTLQFTVDNPFSDKLPVVVSAPLQLNKNLEQSLLSGSIGMQVQNAFYARQNRSFAILRNDTSAFYGIPDASYSLDDYTRFTTLEEVLKEYVPGVLVRKENGKFRLQIYNKEKNFLSNQPMVLMDGVPISDLDRFMSIDPMKLSKLDVISDTYFRGPLKAEGILSFNSYDGDMGDLEPPDGALILDYEGMQYQREFYSPRYTSTEELHSRLPDFRNVLFWSPDINSNLEGKAEANFYTSDQSGKYKIVVQGITRDGKAAMGSAVFEVFRLRR